MKRMLINAAHADELRVAITNNSQLIDLDIELPGSDQKKSNIYKGRITSIEPSLGAVFVDYGSERHGFLPLKEISKEYFLTDDTSSIEAGNMHALLKIGQELVVQVEKEERGQKGAALTTFISLAGSYLVLMPNNPRAGGISRRIDGDERAQLKETIDSLNVPEGMGIIIRTAGLGREAKELEWDMKVLMRYWEAIKQAAIVKAGPYLIHQESDVVIRAIRDYLREDINEIIVDDPTAFERAKNYIEQVRPDFIERLKLYSDHLPLFSRFQIEQQIENAYQREVRLPSGGSIVIDQTEALVAIDINSARATKGSNIEETALHTNLEAADEIARNLRIRDIGGLVVIDFIDMTPVRNQREVENRLRNALRMDRARIQIGRISRFGILEMSRQRLRGSLSKSSQITCPRCEGRGTIRSVESFALSLVHIMQEHAAISHNSQLQIQLPIDVATYLINEKRQTLNEIEQIKNVEIIIIPNRHLQTPHYDLKEIKGDSSTRRTPASYKLVRVPKAEPTNNKHAKIAEPVEPAITSFLKNAPSAGKAAPRKSNSNGLIKRLWGVMFGGDEDQPQPTQGTTSQKSQTASRQGSQRRQSSSDRNTSKRRQGNRNRGGQRRRTQGKRNERGGNANRSRSRQRPQGQGQGQRRRSSPNKAPTTQPTTAEKPVEKPVEKPAEKPVEKPKTNSNYTGLSAPSGEPMVQVTTKKPEDKG